MVNRNFTRDSETAKHLAPFGATVYDAAIVRTYHRGDFDAVFDSEPGEIGKTSNLVVPGGSMDFASLAQQVPRQVGAVLSEDADNKRALNLVFDNWRSLALTDLFSHDRRWKHFD